MLKTKEFIDATYYNIEERKREGKTLEEQLNNFFEAHLDIRLIDVKYDHLISGYPDEGLTPRATALIIYEED